MEASMLSPLKRLIIAKIIDFAIEFSIIYFIFSLLNFHFPLWLDALILCTATSVVFTIDHLFSKYTGVCTIGESIVRVQKNKNFSFRQAVHHLSLVDKSLPERFVYSLIALFFLITPPVLSDYFIDGMSNSVTGLSTSHLKWKPYLDKEEEWKIEFPTKPKMQEKTLKLPNSDHLKLSELIAEHDELSYSIASAKLPDNLLKWSPNLILKGAVKIVSHNSPDTTSKTEPIISFKDYPTLPYSLKSKDKLIMGRLLLIEDTLYKLEVEALGEKAEIAADKVQKFFHSFSPDL
jgi:hypothetical protein